MTTGLLAMAIANPVLAAVVAGVIVLGTGWLAYKARRFLKRLLAPLGQRARPIMKDVTPK